MPYGEHIATCLHCGRKWIVGDCIPSICPDCEAKGHSGWPLDCAACTRDRYARLDTTRKLDESTVYRQAILAARTPWHARQAAKRAKAAGWNFDKTALACRLIELRREAFRIPRNEP